MRIEQVTSSKITNLGLCCAILVVLNHVNPVFSKGTATWYYAAAIAGAPFAVPYFFIVSGFLLAGHMDNNDWYKSNIQKRLFTLIWPFIIWNILQLVFNIILLMGLNYCAHREVMANVDLSTNRLLSAIGLNPFSQPEAGQLWYVRSLFFFICISPLIKRYIGRLLLIFLFILYVAVCPDTSVATGRCRLLFRWFFSLEGLFYFSVGVYLWYNPIKIRISKYMSFFLLVFGLSSFLLGAMFQNWLSYCRVIGNAFSLLGCWGLIPEGVWPPNLTALSFPIYVIHPFLLKIAFLCAKFIPGMGFLRTTLIGWFLVASWGVFCSIGVSRLLLKGEWGKVISKYGFGGRGR